jgi:phosphoglycolate phosphatase-like HAD superfamily hydrolase
VPERVATFDNDGTLWAEKPVPFELLFALARVKELAPQHPEWRTKQPFAAVLKGDLQSVAASGERGVLEIIAATHAGITTDDFSRAVQQWLSSAKHPQTGKAFTAMVYQPMLELLDYLRAHDFKLFIVSGGGVEFMRPWAERVYGIPPEQIVGSAGKLKLAERDGRPVLLKLASTDLIDDKAGKPVGIQSRIGRRPIAAFGNSDGDLQMLEWTTAGGGPHFALLVHHDDAQREFGYDRADKLARLDKAWDAATARGWTVVSMKSDWSTVFVRE